jgi:hypothetical protein
LCFIQNCQPPETADKKAPAPLRGCNKTRALHASGVNLQTGFCSIATRLEETRTALAGGVDPQRMYG